MAVYKVIQDIESEDKLLGPLTLKGFIYVAIAGVLAFIDIRLLLSGASWIIKLIFVLLFLPPMVLFGTLASPLGREQSTEIWLLSRIRFWLKPHTRRWDQNGMKQMVSITAPKKDNRILTKNLSPTDVNSRLQALANTLDSRGWVIKNIAINATPHRDLTDIEAGDERLAGATSLVQPEPVLDVHPSDDILDEANNPTARNMAGLMAQAESERKRYVMAKAEEDSMIIPAQATTLAADEQALLDQVHTRDAQVKNHPPIIHGVNQGDQTVKIELANAGNALSVATIAALANHNAANQSGDINLAQT
jgi:hypothetical protein